MRNSASLSSRNWRRCPGKLSTKPFDPFTTLPAYLTINASQYYLLEFSRSYICKNFTVGFINAKFSTTCYFVEGYRPDSFLKHCIHIHSVSFGNYKCSFKSHVLKSNWSKIYIKLILKTILFKDFIKIFHLKYFIL